MKKRIKLLEFIKQNKTFLLLAAIALILFNHYIVLIGLIIFFWFLGMISFKVTGMIPHVSVETISASSILLGYIWGWKWGLGFGLIFGLYGYIQISRIKLKSIINVLLMGLGGVLSAIFASLNYSFTIAYMFTFIIRIILNNIIFPLVESDMMENVIHGFGDPIFNMLITFQIMNLIYNIVILFPK